MNLRPILITESIQIVRIPRFTLVHIPLLLSLKVYSVARIRRLGQQ